MKDIKSIVRTENISIDKNKSIKGDYELFLENKLKYTKQDLNTINTLISELYIDQETALIQWANPTALQQFGQEIIDSPIETLIDADAWSSFYHKLVREKEVSDQKIKIGSRWYLISCSYHEENVSQQSILLVCKDVTEYENYLMQGNQIWMKRERMEMALLGGKTSVLDLDFRNNSCYISPKWKEMLGYTDAELPNTLFAWERRTYGEDIKKIISLLRKNILEKKKYFETTHRLKHKDGHFIWVLGRAQILYDENGQAIRMVGTDTDITEEKELQLKYSHQAQIIEQIHDAVTSVDQDGYIRSCNPATEQLLGYKREEIIGKHLKSFYVEEDYNAVQEKFNKIKQEGVLKAKIRLVKKTKEIVYAELTLSQLRDETGKVIGRVGYTRDITKQKQAEDEIRRLNTSLQKEVACQLEELRKKDKLILQQSRMAQMGEMLSMIAHQWRQPLAAISATSASIEVKAALNTLNNDVAQEKARDIATFSQHLSNTIDDFRDFFKPNKKKVETSYCEILQSVLMIIGSSIKNKNITLVKEYGCQDKFITYSNELKQVILNLTKNAEDVLLEQEIENPTITIRTHKENNKYILEISDNAGGIPEDIIDKIFDPYFSTKVKKNGTGLGLYMSKTIIEKHCGGEISVENIKEGALFRISLHDI